MAKNYLTATKELKAKIETLIDEILANDAYFCSEDGRRKDFVDFTGRTPETYHKFKTTYCGCTTSYNHVYNILTEVVEYFYDSNYNFAEAGKKVRDELKNWIETLQSDSEYFFSQCYSNWLTEQKNNEDRYIEHEYPNGSTYFEYIEPTYDDFIENLCEVEYTSDYEDYNNMEEAAYLLCEEFCNYIDGLRF